MPPFVNFNVLNSQPLDLSQKWSVQHAKSANTTYGCCKAYVLGIVVRSFLVVTVFNLRVLQPFMTGRQIGLEHLIASALVDYIL